MSPQSTGALKWDVWQLRVATDAAGVALWSWNVDDDTFTMDERAYDLWGVPKREAITFQELSSRIHPEDLDKVRASFAATRDVVGAYETDFRILHGSKVRWISARGRGDDQGIVGRVMFGIFIDVSVRKLAEEAREMIAGEMNHRIKNLFAVAASLTRMAARSAGTKEQMALDLTRRLDALSAAHDLVRTDLNAQSKAVPIGDLLAVLLAPYMDGGSEAAQVRVAAQELLIGEFLRHYARPDCPRTGDQRDQVRGALFADRRAASDMRGEGRRSHAGLGGNRRPTRGRSGRADGFRRQTVVAQRVWPAWRRHERRVAPGRRGLHAARQQGQARRLRAPLLHHDLRPLRHAPVEVDHVGVEHADAARRHRFADAFGLVGAVDAEQRVLVVLE